MVNRVNCSLWLWASPPRIKSADAMTNNKLKNPKNPQVRLYINWSNPPSWNWNLNLCRPCVHNLLLRTEQTPTVNNLVFPSEQTTTVDKELHCCPYACLCLQDRTVVSRCSEKTPGKMHFFWWWVQLWRHCPHQLDQLIQSFLLQSKVNDIPKIYPDQSVLHSP